MLLLWMRLLLLGWMVLLLLRRRRLLLLTGMAALHYGAGTWGHISQDMRRLVDRSEPRKKTNGICKKNKRFIIIGWKFEGNREHRHVVGASVLLIYRQQLLDVLRLVG